MLVLSRFSPRFKPFKPEDERFKPAYVVFVCMIKKHLHLAYKKKLTENLKYVFILQTKTVHKKV